MGDKDDWMAFDGGKKMRGKRWEKKEVELSPFEWIKSCVLPSSLKYQLEESLDKRERKKPLLLFSSTFWENRTKRERERMGEIKSLSPFCSFATSWFFRRKKVLKSQLENNFSLSSILCQPSFQWERERKKEKREEKLFPFVYPITGKTGFRVNESWEWMVLSPSIPSLSLSLSQFLLSHPSPFLSLSLSHSRVLQILKERRSERGRKRSEN